MRDQFLSTSPESSFAGVVTSQLWFETGTTILKGCVLTKRAGDESTTETVDERAGWFTMLDDVFDIRPDAPPDALDALAGVCCCCARSLVIRRRRLIRAALFSRERYRDHPCS